MNAKAFLRGYMCKSAAQSALDYMPPSRYQPPGKLKPSMQTSVMAGQNNPSAIGTPSNVPQLGQKNQLTGALPSGTNNAPSAPGNLPVIKPPDSTTTNILKTDATSTALPSTTDANAKTTPPLNTTGSMGMPSEQPPTNAFGAVQ